MSVSFPPPSSNIQPSESTLSDDDWSFRSSDNQGYGRSHGAICVFVQHLTLLYFTLRGTPQRLPISPEITRTIVPIIPIFSYSYIIAWTPHSQDHEALALRFSSPQCIAS